MRIRCRQCRKKISIDDGFAGGLCRCPYCKAITMASGAASAGCAERPDRPDSPNEVVASQARQAESDETVPLAEPVAIQGITRMLLPGLLILLLVAGVILIIMYVLFYR